MCDAIHDLAVALMSTHCTLRLNSIPAVHTVLATPSTAHTYTAVAVVRNHLALLNAAQLQQE
jgi:hypothetical protein